MGAKKQALYQDARGGPSRLKVGPPPSLLGGVVTGPRISSNARAAQLRAFAHAAHSPASVRVPPRPPPPAALVSPGILSPFQRLGDPGWKSSVSAVGRRPSASSAAPSHVGETRKRAGPSRLSAPRWGEEPRNPSDSPRRRPRGPALRSRLCAVGRGRHFAHSP